MDHECKSVCEHGIENHGKSSLKITMRVYTEMLDDEVETSGSKLEKYMAR